MSEINPYKTADVEALVTASQKGDSDAFGKLYDLFIQPIYRYVYYRVGAEEAEDLTELIFLKTWENISQYRQQNHSFSSWIFRIAHNVVIDYYRSYHRIEELSMEIEDSRVENSAKHQAHRRFDNELLSKAMKELKDHYRQVLILKYIEDLPNEEIAWITSKSQAALRILQFRALKSLRRIIERMGISEFEL